VLSMSAAASWKPGKQCRQGLVFAEGLQGAVRGSPGLVAAVPVSRAG